MKDFDSWNEEKKRLENAKETHFREGEVWWFSCGINIGREIDGKPPKYRRPGLIIKKFNSHACLIIPLSKIEKKDKYIFPLGEVGGINAYSNLSQVRSISSKKLYEIVQTIDRQLFEEIKKTARNILFSDGFQIVPPNLEGGAWLANK